MEEANFINEVVILFERTSEIIIMGTVISLACFVYAAVKLINGTGGASNALIGAAIGVMMVGWAYMMPQVTAAITGSAGGDGFNIPGGLAMILPLVTATAAAFVWRNSWGHATLWSATVISGYWAAVMISQGQGIGWAGALLAAIIALHLTALGANQLRGGWTGHLHTARSAAALTGTSAAGMAMLLTTL